MKYNQKSLIDITSNFILLPFCNGEPESKVEFISSNKATSLSFTAKITSGKAQYYHPIQVSQFKGQTLKLKIGSENKIKLSELHIAQQEDLPLQIFEKYRPLLHLTAPWGWMDFPFAFNYSNQHYQLHFLNNLHHTDQQHAHWTTVLSKNLMQWQMATNNSEYHHLHNKNVDYIVIDKLNTSNLGKQTTFAFYKYPHKNHKLYLAYKLDTDGNFTQFDNNPIVTSKNGQELSSPKVFYHEQTQNWVMLITMGHSIAIYNSADLLTWQETSVFKYPYTIPSDHWHSPDLFPLQYGSQTKWILMHSTNAQKSKFKAFTLYQVGDFDGRVFKADEVNEVKILDFGRDCYAGRTNSNHPKGKTLWIAWMNNLQYAHKTPTTTFQNAMTLPRILELTKVQKQYIVASFPIKETKQHRVEKQSYPSRLLDKTTTIKSMLENNSGAFEIVLDFDIIDVSTKSFTLTLSNSENEEISYTYHFKKDKIYMNRNRSGQVDFDSKFTSKKIKGPLYEIKKYKTRLIVDKCSTELFINKGKVTMTNLIFPTEPYNQLTLSVEEGSVDISKFNIYQLDL